MRRLPRASRGFSGLLGRGWNPSLKAPPHPASRQLWASGFRKLRELRSPSGGSASSTAPCRGSLGGALAPPLAPRVSALGTAAGRQRSRGPLSSHLRRPPPQLLGVYRTAVSKVRLCGPCVLPSLSEHPRAIGKACAAGDVGSALPPTPPRPCCLTVSMALALGRSARRPFSVSPGDLSLLPGVRLPGEGG